jgi:hypothetical protein
VLKFTRIVLLVGVATMVCAEVPVLVGCTSIGVINGSVAAPTLATGGCAATEYVVSTTWSNTWTIDDTNTGTDATTWYMLKCIEKDPDTCNTITVANTNGWGKYTNIACGNNFTKTNVAISTASMANTCVSCKNINGHNYSHKIRLVPGYGAPQNGGATPETQGASADSTYVTTPTDCGHL